MSPQSVLGCPACGMRINGTESECPRCHRKFDEGFKFECPFCGGPIPKGSKRCPSCLIDLHTFGGHDQESVDQKTDNILQELIQLESALVKQEEKRYCCPDCSWLLSGTESKCPKCGRSLAGENSLTCPVCMGAIRKDAKVCDRCGAILRAEKMPDEASPVSPQLPPPPPPEPSVVQPVEPDLTEIESLFKCPHCGASAKMEATACPSCGRSLVESEQPIPQEEETTSEEAATEAIKTLGVIERQARGPKTRKLRPGRVTTIGASTQGSGRGLSNGLGQTNGTSKVNGRSKINGTGRVNGRVNGTGAVNGRSLVNGRGLSNGLRTKTAAHTGKRYHLMLKWQFLAVLVAVIIIIPTIIYLGNSRQSEPITVDGDFSDWADITKFGAHTQSGSSSLDFAEWATTNKGPNMYLFARTLGPLMASEEPESFFLFIDSDGAASTGYLADGTGADYMLRIDGWNGSAQSSELQARVAGADQYDWNSWETAGTAVAKVEGSGIEAKGVLPVTLSTTARFMLMSKDSNDRGATTYPAPSEGGLLIVRLEPSTEATDGVIPAASTVSLMSARFTCQGAGGTVSTINPVLSGATIASQMQSFPLSPGEERVVDISVNSANAAIEQFVTANLLPSDITSTFAAVQIDGQQVSAYVGAAPQGIVIDGAFGDWAGKTTVDEDTSQVRNADIDIDSTGNYSTSQSSYFYVSVKDELGKGNCVPALVRKPSGTGGGDHGIPVRKTGEDLLRVYIDSDMSPSTGLGLVYESKVIGADHKVEIAGINGKIVLSSYWNYSAGHWIQSPADILSAKDFSQIEIGIDSRLVDGRQAIDFLVETTSWKDEFDRACYNPTGTRTLTARVTGNAHIESWVDGISTSPWATSMSYQRKLFWDGTNYWSFYFDGSDTVHKYSTTGTTWSGRGSVFKTTGVNETSIWYDSANNVVYAIGDTGTASTNVYIQKGTVNPATHLITWAASDSTLATSTNSLAGKNTFISRDTSGYLWVLSNNRSSTSPDKYQLTVFKSSVADSITSWEFSGHMLPSPNTDQEARGSVVPGLSGTMWSIYGYSGTVASRKYTGTWQSPQTGIYSAGGQGLNLQLAPPSVVVDSLGVVHVVYGATRKSGAQPYATQYVHNNTGATTYTTEVDLDAYRPSDVGDIYPTISLDTSTNNLYVLWLRTDTSGIGITVMARKCVGGTWSNLTIGDQTSYPKQYLTSIYSVAGEFSVCWQWTENTTATIHVMFDRIIPEFEDVLLPMFVVMVFCIAFRSRAKKRHPE